MKDIWVEKIHTMFRKKPKEEEEIFLDIVSMIAYHRYDDKLSALYKELGVETFNKVIAILSGETVSFPDRQDWHDSMLTALCFYYKMLKGYDWDKIKKILPIKRINSIKIGKRINSLNADIVTKIYESFNKIETIGGDINDFEGYC
jgi:hypothetical protein